MGVSPTPTSQNVGEKLIWIAIYSLCSSSMLVVNKLAVAAIPLPTVVSGAQLVSSAIVPLLMQLCGYSVIGKMTYARSLPYVVYTSMFAAGLFANMKALLLTNVGAVIAARCCLPLIVSVIEYFFMGRSWPNKRSMVSLVRVWCWCCSFSRSIFLLLNLLFFRSLTLSSSLFLLKQRYYINRVASSSSLTCTFPKTRASPSKVPKGSSGSSSGGCFWRYR